MTEKPKSQAGKGGRPRVATGSKSFTVKISTRLKQRLDLMSKLGEISIAVIVRKALEEWLNYNFHTSKTIDSPEKIWQDFGEKVTLVCEITKKYSFWNLENDFSVLEKSNLTFTITPILHENLKKFSKKQNKNQSEIIEKALDSWLIKFSKHETESELFTNLGAWITMQANNTREMIINSFGYENSKQSKVNF